MAETSAGADLEENDDLMEDIKMKLKDPYLMANKKEKTVGLTLSPQGAVLHSLLETMIGSEKSTIDTEVKYVVSLPAFEIFLGKVFEYLDEIYYIEKRRGIFENREGGQQVTLLASEKERLTLKASECAYAYSGVLFKTVWRPNLKWDSVISFMLRVVKEGYKREKNKEVCEKIYFASRLLRTSNFNRNERDGVRKLEERKVRVLLRENLPKWSNIDGMQNMITLRKAIPKSVKGHLRDNLNKGNYKPYNMKPSVLKSKDTNSILLACILPNVNDKRLVEYRMKSQSVEKERLRGVRGKVVTYIDEGLEKVQTNLNNSNFL